VYAVAADRYHVHVTDDQVRTRITQLLGGNDPDAAYAQLAQQGVSRQDVFDSVRQQLVRRQIAADRGQAPGLSDAELQARYAQVRESLRKFRMGYVTVPDQATADRVLARLTADPASYASVAGQYAGPYTLPTVEERSADQVPQPLATGVAAARPGTGFSVALPETNGVVYPTFEEVRGDLEKEAGDKADAAGAKVIDQVRTDLGVTINPRYGRLQNGSIVPSGGGVVDILEQAGATSSTSGGSATDGK
jgi:peptidyl-prolyl cis-trans isomerase SurA